MGLEEGLDTIIRRDESDDAGMELVNPRRPWRRAASQRS